MRSLARIFQRHRHDKTKITRDVIYQIIQSSNDDDVHTLRCVDDWGIESIPKRIGYLLQWMRRHHNFMPSLITSFDSKHITRSEIWEKYRTKTLNRKYIRSIVPSLWYMDIDQISCERSFSFNLISLFLRKNIFENESNPESLRNSIIT